MAGKDEEATIVREISKNPSAMQSGLKIVSQGDEGNGLKFMKVKAQKKKKAEESESVSGNESESPSDSGESMSIDLTSQRTEDKDTGDGLLDEKMARLDVKELKQQIKRHISHALQVEQAAVDDESKQDGAGILPLNKKDKKHNTSLNLLSFSLKDLLNNPHIEIEHMHDDDEDK